MTAPIPTVIDTDIGADPDDALALILALASPEVDVRGVTIVSGDVTWRARIATRLLGMAGRSDIPVFLGHGDPHQMLGAEGEGVLDLPYHGPEATIRSEPAVDWLLTESRRRPFHFVAIGPLTNVAAAIEQDPGFAERLLGLTVMGGLLDERTMPTVWQRVIQQQGPTAWPDYNTMSDPAAALTVARCGIPITWVTLDVTMCAPLRAAARGMLPDHSLGAALGRMIDAWHVFWFPTALPPPDDPSPVPADAIAILHDPLALASLFAGEWLRLRPARLASGIEDGVFHLSEHPSGAPARLAAGVDGAAFEAFLLARIMRLVSRLSESAAPQILFRSPAPGLPRGKGGPLGRRGREAARWSSPLSRGPLFPSIALDLRGGDIWAWQKPLAGTCTGSLPDATIVLLVNGTPVAAERESDGFTAATKFDPDDNEVLAVAKMPDGSEVRSARATSTVRLEPRPTARLGVKIDAGHVNFDSTASQPSEFDAAIKTWLVAPRKDNPAPLDLHETTPGIRSAVVPAADGEY